MSTPKVMHLLKGFLFGEPKAKCGYTVHMHAVTTQHSQVTCERCLKQLEKKHA